MAIQTETYIAAIGKADVPGEDAQQQVVGVAEGAGTGVGAVEAAHYAGEAGRARRILVDAVVTGLDHTSRTAPVAAGSVVVVALLAQDPDPVPTDGGTGGCVCEIVARKTSTATCEIVTCAAV